MVNNFRMNLVKLLRPLSKTDHELLAYASVYPSDRHLMGIFYRTIRMAENGIKPVYVFDGKPPDLKKGVVCSYH